MGYRGFVGMQRRRIDGDLKMILTEVYVTVENSGDNLVYRVIYDSVGKY